MNEKIQIPWPQNIFSRGSSLQYVSISPHELNVRDFKIQILQNNVDKKAFERGSFSDFYKLFIDVNTNTNLKGMPPIQASHKITCLSKPQYKHHTKLNI